MNIKEWWNSLQGRRRETIKRKSRFVVMDSETFEEHFSFQLTGANLFVTIGVTVIVLILLTTILIAFTPLREWIPGYTDTYTIEQTIDNARKIDSLETLVDEQAWMLNTIQAALRGEPLGLSEEGDGTDSAVNLQQAALAYSHSKEDTLLRQEVEREDNRYNMK